MRIYTGNPGGAKLDICKEYNLGIMISSSITRYPSKVFNEYDCALDNGAFSNYKKGYPFIEYTFLKTLAKCYQHKIKLDFIVCPDIIAGGLKSLDFSMRWSDRLICDNLALVVQDGMMPEHITDDILSRFSYIFIGGTVDWKWCMAETWVDFAREKNKKVHLGQCGRLKHLLTAKELGVDSCDSTSWVVNDSWHILDEFYNIESPTNAPQ